MPIVKCQNPQCDYFQKPVPEGEYCPFCGEPLPIQQGLSLSAQFPIPQPLPEPPITPPAPSITPPAPVYQQPAQPPVTPPAPVYQQPAQPPVTPPAPVYQQPAQPPVTPSKPVSLPDTAPTLCEPGGLRKPRLNLIHVSGKEFPVLGHKVYIGRRGGTKKPQPEIDITDIPHAERVSRPHAHFFWDEKTQSYMIVDNDSTNGTILNDEILIPWHPYPLRDGAILELGKEHLVQFRISLR